MKIMSQEIPHSVVILDMYILKTLTPQWHQKKGKKIEMGKKFIFWGSYSFPFKVYPPPDCLLVWWESFMSICLPILSDNGLASTWNISFLIFLMVKNKNYLILLIRYQVIQ